MIKRLIAAAALLLISLGYAGNAAATFHLYRINELFSSADGSIQFIELSVGPFDGQNLWAGQSISVFHAATAHSFTFPADLPSAATANTSVLIATQGFADLGIVAPDFIVPAGFLFTDGGVVNFANVDSMSYTSLPTDGIRSLNHDGTIATNSPTNFAGASGSALAFVSQNVVPGWNLLGNGSRTTLDVVAALGDAAKVNSVWKWNGANGSWDFYTPTLPDGGAANAASHGFGVLSSINAGEGFWVNANSAFTLQLPAGAPMPSASHQNMSPGWNLIAIGDRHAPLQFIQSLSNSLPAPGVIPPNVISLWNWDAGLANWYFFAPSLAAQGGTVLPDFLSAKGFLDFGTRVLEPASGFWVNGSRRPPL